MASHSGAMAAKWQSLQPVIRIETQMLDLCRADSHLCVPATSRFLAIVEAARPLSGRAQVGAVNRAVNLAIRPVSDAARFKVPDVWTTPLMTFSLGAGDCEDYAIAKYVALREAGMDAADLRLMIVRDRALNQDHAVTAARVDGEWLILDNRRMLLLNDTDAVNLTPLVALDSEDAIPVRAAAVVAKANG
jgi:predicted transglutaminase-like cysteine proteinase